MKAIYTSLVFFFFYSSLVRAQQFSPTTGLPCVSCVPANYNAIGTPFISNIYDPGIDSTGKLFYWGYYNGTLEYPPSNYSTQLPQNGGQYSFVSLKTSEGAVNDKLYLDVSGFETSKTYAFKYSVNGAGIYFPYSPLAQSATMEIMTVDQFPLLIASQTAYFDPDITQPVWTNRTITFQPTASTLRFRLSGKTVGQTPGYVHFSIDKYPFDCNLPQNVQVALGQSTIPTIFPGEKLDLSKVRIDSDTPTNTEIVWKTNPNSVFPSLTP